MRCPKCQTLTFVDHLEPARDYGERCTDALADDYLAKPVSLHVLLSTIDLRLRERAEPGS